uniref:VWFA domain-containing protein n=1 Tax=Panagrolaimus davidi TaxID=227884 RepID=A0A914QRR3_9BILA
MFQNARIGIVLSTGFTPGEPTSPYRYNDLKGCPSGYNSIYCSPTVISTDDLKKAINDIPFYGGNNNDIALSMNISLTGDYNGFPAFYEIFGDKIFNGYGDRSSVPNAMIVISGADSSNVTQASNLLKLAGIQVFSIGFEDLPISQLHAISGKPSRAFSTSPENLANTIRKICTGDFEDFSTITSTPSTLTSTTKAITIPTTTVATTATTKPSTTTTTKPPTTTVDSRPFTPLNCSGAMDLVFVIDVCSTTEENLNLVKSQLEYAIKQNGIKWESTDNNTARLGIILSATSFADGVTTPYRYLDFQGRQTSPYQYPKLVTRTIHLKQVFRDIAFDLGTNNIGLSMNYSINGDYANPDLPFGDPIFGSEGDRPNVPNAMIVITGADTSNVTIPSALLRNSNVDIYSIGFEDVSMAHLQAISGNPAKAFLTTRVNLANTIKNICAGYLNDVPTTTPSPTTTTSTPVPSTTTTTVQPQPFIPLNCSGAMDLVFVIDVCSTTEENLNLVKSQLEYAIKQNGIKWESTDNNTARLGIILSATSFADGVTTPYRYLDFQGRQTSPYQYPKLVTRTIHLKQVFRDIAFDLGTNNIGLSMNYSINGDYANPDLPFGDPIFGSEGDRPNVPNAMIVITGADTSNVTIPSALLRNSNVDIYSIGFEDVSMAHLQAISGNPAKAFLTTRVNLANTISNICAGFLNE